MKTSSPSLKYWIFAGLAALLLTPATAHADVGTPLMWATLLHLFIGNLLIGIFEGYLLAKFFKLPKLRSIILMIIANYVSMWLGGLLLLGWLSSLISVDLSSGRWIYPGLILLSFILTLLMEYPFVFGAFKGVQGKWKKAWKGTLLTQTLSYIILFGWYGMTSHATLYTENKVVQLSEMELPKEVTIYFISSEDGNVYSGNLLEQNWKKVYDIDEKWDMNCLNVWPSEANTNLWDLILCCRRKNEKNTKVILEDIAQDAEPSRDSRLTKKPYTEPDKQLYTSSAPQIGEAKQSSWYDFRTGSWAWDGFWGRNKKTNKKVRVSFEIPYGSGWWVRFVTHLPTDKILFQLGRDQICLYDLNKKQVALVARGSSPLAVIGKKGSSDEK